MIQEQIRKGNPEVTALEFSKTLQDWFGQILSHRTDELVVLAEGEIEIEIEGKSQQSQIGDEVFIPANAIHTVRNIGKTNNVWYYGYKS